MAPFPAYIVSHTCSPLGAIKGYPEGGGRGMEVKGESNVV